MKLSNKTYDALKWVAMVGFYAVGTCYFGLAEIWHLPYATEIVKTCSVLGTFLGTLLGISHINYKAELENNSYTPPQDFVNHEIVEDEE